MKNILICSVGRRVELVKSFIQQVSKLELDAKVYAIDSNAQLSSGCQVADKLDNCPRVDQSEYADFLLAYAIKNNIGMIIPTIDTELLMLSSEKKRFQQHEISIVISSPELVVACRDKRQTGDIFKGIDIEYPEVYEKDRLVFPCFAKPYNGSSSEGVCKINRDSDITAEMSRNDKLMYMQFIDSSYDEYTIDAYYSDGQLKCFVPRKRMEVRAGEISKGITIKSWLYDLLKPRLTNLKGASGCITIQVFVNDTKQHCIGLEINPRFGGGYPLSYAAGANYSGWLIQEYLLHSTIDFYEQWEGNLLMLRYDEQVLVRDAYTV
ncbi:MAG: ATP-grasp domain-containing protein [Coxiellaceae bacterium]|nr:ATP-grasp domain-containing protein [Coxiellaceae bacterium]